MIPICTWLYIFNHRMGRTSIPLFLLLTAAIYLVMTLPALQSPLLACWARPTLSSWFACRLISAHVGYPLFMGTYDILLTLLVSSSSFRHFMCLRTFWPKSGIVNHFCKLVTFYQIGFFLKPFWMNLIRYLLCTCNLRIPYEGGYI